MRKKPLIDVPVSIEDLFGDFGDVVPPPDPEPEPVPSLDDPEPEPEPVVEADTVAPVEPDSDRPPYVHDPPLGRDGRRYFLDCGHANFHTEADHAAARAEGFCCVDGKKKRVVASWTALRGPYLRPLPVSMRRTREKERGLGFPGYCCDDEGWYIGGIGNNCPVYRPSGAPLCRAHRPPSADPPPPEPEEVEVLVLDEDAAPAPAPKLSMKQRQMAARKKGKKP